MLRVTFKLNSCQTDHPLTQQNILKSNQILFGGIPDSNQLLFVDIDSLLSLGLASKCTSIIISYFLNLNFQHLPESLMLKLCQTKTLSTQQFYDFLVSTLVILPPYSVKFTASFVLLSSSRSQVL